MSRFDCEGLWKLELDIMPKMKSHKGLARRCRLTTKGKVKYKKAGSGHLMSHKTGNRCRNLRKSAILASAIGKLYSEILSNG